MSEPDRKTPAPDGWRSDGASRRDSAPVDRASGQSASGDGAPRDSAPGDPTAQIELTYNWPAPDGTVETYTGGRSFGHVAYAVDNIYAACQRLMDHGVTLNRPPRDGRMAFVRSPDGISIELLQAGPALAPAEPWTALPNIGSW